MIRRTKLAVGTGVMLLANIVFADEIQRMNPPALVDSAKWGFSQVVIVPTSGKTVFLAGQFSGNTEGIVTGDTVEEQMTAAFANLRAAISAAGAQPHHVVQIRVFIVGHREKYLLQVAAEAKALFGDALPASTLIPVPRLALDDMLFEIEATLFVPG